MANAVQSTKNVSSDPGADEHDLECSRESSPSCSQSSAVALTHSNGGSPSSINSIEIHVDFPDVPTTKSHGACSTNNIYGEEQIQLCEIATLNHNVELSKSSNSNQSASISQCRYCYIDICRNMSASQCHCNGNLCQECFMKEILLTYNRQDHEPQCTVCNKKYEIEKRFVFNPFTDCCKLLCFLECCGLRNEQFLLNNIGIKLGYIMVVFGIAVWIIATGLLFSLPSPSQGFPAYLYYVISAFDLIVGISTLWFVLKCRCLTSFFLAVLYLLRSAYLMMGWIPSLNILNFEHFPRSHVNAACYFVSFSFMAFVLLSICSMVDILHQFNQYKVSNQKLIVNGVSIDLNRTRRSNRHHENDRF